MTLTTNKAVLGRLVEEVINLGNLAVVDELLPADHRSHLCGNPTPLNREEFKQFVTMMRTSFANMHETIEEMIAEGNTVTFRWRSHGTHRGEFLGIPPSGRDVSFTGTTTARVADGRIVEMWFEPDMQGLMHQLGAIAAHEPAGL